MHLVLEWIIYLINIHETFLHVHLCAYSWRGLKSHIARNYISNCDTDILYNVLFVPFNSTPNNCRSYCCICISCWITLYSSLLFMRRSRILIYAHIHEGSKVVYCRVSCVNHLTFGSINLFCLLWVLLFLIAGHLV